MIDGLKPYPEMKDSGVSWLGEVPEQWQVRPVGGMGSLFKGNGGNKGDEVPAGIPCVRYGDLYTRHEFFITKSKACVSKERAGQYTPIRYGDVLFAASGETMEDIGRSAVILIEGEARCGGDVLVLRPEVPAVPRYLGYAADSPASRNQKACMGRGFTVVHIYGSQLKRLLLPLPPLPEQAAIVRFLDYADRRIRRYVRAKQKLIELLEEQKRAIIHRAVTRGLDPDVRLKPSGVEWLGEVPEHWDVQTLGRLATSFRTGPFGSILHQSDYIEGGTPLVNPTHMNGGNIVEDRRCSVPISVVERLSDYVLAKHDLVFSRRGELGRCALVRDREAGWVCGTGSIRVRMNYDGIEPEFLIEALQVAWVGEYLSLLSVGATMDSLNTGILKGLPVLVPPVNEQRQLLETTARLALTVRQAAGSARREIDLLREYRTRLIADVVTGKLDVREAAAQLPDEVGEPEGEEAFEELDAVAAMEPNEGDTADPELETIGA